jgi:formamidopyrimidine-DNA glycosylase
MPELPEVEVMARNLARWTRGRTLGAAHRRAKLCLLPVGDDVLVLHFRMTGKVVPDRERPRPPRLRLRLDPGPNVVFEDVRRLGDAWLVPAGDLSGFLEQHAPGPEPWPSPREGAWLARRLGRGRAAVKPALLDGRRLSGVGNIGAAEACWHAGVDPRTPLSALSPRQHDALMTGIRTWIEDTLAAEVGQEIVYVQHGGPNPFRVYGRAGAACPRCGHPVGRLEQSGRATFWCPGCQS